MTVRPHRIYRGGARSYSNYVTGPAADVDGPSMPETTELSGDLSATYARYALSGDKSVGRWSGKQAELWGLVGEAVDADTLTLVLDHRAPDGTDLDDGRVSRTEKLVAAQEVHERELARWERNNERLMPKAEAFDELAEALEADPDLDEHTIVEMLSEPLGVDRAMLVAGAVEKARVVAAEAERSAAEAVAAGEKASSARVQTPVEKVRSMQRQWRCAPPAPPLIDTRSQSLDVIAYDMTHSVPKSVSVLFAAAVARNDWETVDRILACVRRATDATVSRLEDELTAARSGKGGRTREEVVGLSVASVEHFTARPAGDPPLTDPQLHTHMVISARVQTADGRWLSLDSRTWFSAVRSISGDFDANVRAELTAEFGVAYRQKEVVSPENGRKSMVWEIDFGGEEAEQDRLLEMFSRRDSDIRAEYEKQRAEGKRVSKHDVWQETRAGKSEATLAESADGWGTRMTDAGFDADLLVSGAVNRASSADIARARTSLTREAMANIRAEFDNLTAEEVAEFMERTDFFRSVVEMEAARLARERGHFTRIDLLCAVQQLAGPYDGAGRSALAVDVWLDRSAELVKGPELKDPTGWATQARFTTSEQLNLERETLDIIERLASAEASGVPLAEVDALVRRYQERGTPLSDEQEKLVRTALDGSLITIAEAAAGSGKSFSAAAAAEAHRAHHGEKAKVVAVSLAASAGNTLGADLRDGAELAGSIDRLLLAIDEGRFTLDERTMVVADEAGMASTAKLHDLLAACEKAGSRVLAFGDPQQLQAVAAAGGLLRHMQVNDHPRLVSLTATRRAADPEVREAQETWRDALRAGSERDAAATMRPYLDRGWVETVDGSETIVEAQAFDRWLELTKAAADRRRDWERNHQPGWVARGDQLRADAGAAVRKLHASKRNTPTEQLAKLEDAAASARAALAKHAKEPAAFIADDIAVISATHAEAAALSDRIQEHLVAAGALSEVAVVEGRRFDGSGEPIVAADGRDLSHTTFMKGLQVRITKNGAGEGGEFGHFDAQQARLVELGREAAEQQQAAFDESIRQRRITEAEAWIGKRADTLSDEKVDSIRAAARSGPAYRPNFSRQQGRKLSEKQLLAMGIGTDEGRRIFDEGRNAARGWNGEIAVVEAVHPEDNEVTVRFSDGRLVRYSEAQLNDGVVVPAAGGARTVHSAQGQTYDQVVLAAADAKSLDAYLTYVAMTRARHEAHMVAGVDLSEENPELTQWRNDRRRAEMNGDLATFTKPEPVDELPGLWQVRRAWSQATGDEMAYSLLVESVTVDAEWEAKKAKARANLARRWQLDPDTISDEAVAEEIEKRDAFEAREAALAAEAELSQSRGLSL